MALMAVERILKSPPNRKLATRANHPHWLWVGVRV
jgi:hypothetical protein